MKLTDGSTAGVRSMTLLVGDDVQLQLQKEVELMEHYCVTPLVFSRQSRHDD